MYERPKYTTNDSTQHPSPKIHFYFLSGLDEKKQNVALLAFTIMIG